MGKIIIADDVEDNREFLSYILSPVHEVIRCQDGKTLLAQLKHEKPDVIILDITLPDMTGYDVVDQIRKDPRLRNTPVVAVTAHAMLGDRDKCLKAGFTDYVSKPILDLDEFLALIARHINRGSAAR